MSTQLERMYQPKLIETIKREFPGAVVLKNDPQHIQGIPDLLVLCGPRWAMLETKRQSGSSRRPNQPYYVDLFNRMSYASFVNPENEQEVLHEIQYAFSPFK